MHHVKPGAVSLSQATEWGTVYALTEVSALAAVARQHGLPVHMDGARFANALVHLGCTAAAATWQSGVDVLSLGATKNGALCAEAVVFFDPDRARDFERRRKRAGTSVVEAAIRERPAACVLRARVVARQRPPCERDGVAPGQGLRDIAGARLLQSVQAPTRYSSRCPKRPSPP